jgi:hypothetical protein
MLQSGEKSFSASSQIAPTVVGSDENRRLNQWFTPRQEFLAWQIDAITAAASCCHRGSSVVPPFLLR